MRAPGMDRNNSVSFTCSRCPTYRNFVWGRARRVGGRVIMRGQYLRVKNLREGDRSNVFGSAEILAQCCSEKRTKSKRVSHGGMIERFGRKKRLIFPSIGHEAIDKSDAAFFKNPDFFYCLHQNEHKEI